MSKVIEQIKDKALLIFGLSYYLFVLEIIIITFLIIIGNEIGNHIIILSTLIPMIIITFLIYMVIEYIEDRKIKTKELSTSVCIFGHFCFCISLVLGLIIIPSLFILFLLFCLFY